VRAAQNRMSASLLDYCQHTVVLYGGVLTTLLAAGAVGSFTHCAGMCGPFVMAQTTARLSAVPAGDISEWGRLRGAALLPYHLGRITTYAALGVLTSGLARAVVMTTGFKALSAFMLLAAGILFLTAAFKDTKLASWKISLPQFGRIQSSIASKAGAFLLRPTGINGYIAGVLLGFLPCGLLYSALLIAGSATPGVAAAGMALFGLGTVPALFAVSYGTSRAGKRFAAPIRKLGRVCMLANGILLIALAVRSLI
jgi:sulfite exporter TauE/SafE